MSFQLHPSAVRMAERLAHPQLINGVLFDGSEPVDYYAVTDTAPAIREKIIEIHNYEPTVGAQIAVKFPDGNTAQNPTLNINGYGPVPIQYCGQQLRTDAIKPDHTYTLAFDGEAYQIISGYTDTPEVRQLIDDLDDKQTKALNQAKIELNNRITEVDNRQTANLNQAKTELNDKIDKLEAKHDDDMNKLRTDLNKKIDDTKTELNTKIDNNYNDLNSKITALDIKTATNLENAKKELNKTIKDLETKHDNDMKNMKATHEADIKNLTIYIDGKDKGLQDQIDALKKTHDTDNKATNKRIDDIKAVVIDSPTISNTKLYEAINNLKSTTYDKTQVINIIKNTRNILKFVNVTAHRTINTTFTNPTNVDGSTVVDATNNTDNGTLFNVASGKIITIPKAANGFYVYIRSTTGNITITGNGCTIDGNASITLSKLMCVLLVSDGTNYYSLDTSARFQS